jgi:hypothetical protein
MNGKGIFYYNNGDRYDGNWKDDKKNGQGIYYFNNGDRYDGNWKDDKKMEKVFIILITVIVMTVIGKTTK